MHRKLIYGVVGIAIIAVAFAYWPIVHANFVWDDWIDFHIMAWLRQGDEWKHFIFRDFNGWTNYFRPLVVALFTLQLRLFDGAPGPMHAVSLAMHLVNTLLVGLLSWRCAQTLASELKQVCFLAASMLLYGLHPVLIESVAWIGCQFELVLTMLTLCGLLANTSIQGTMTRTIVVATLFFLTACTKESAVSFPLILVVFDWAIICRRHTGSMRLALRALIGRNWLACTAMLLAGIIYLCFRYWALGEIISPVSGNSPSGFAHVQEVCFLYLHHWRTLIWPMSGMSPIHPVDIAQFNIVSVSSVLVDAAAISIVATGFYLALRRSSAIGCMIVVVTASLFPVLHILSLNFDTNLYHERYVTTALAVICAMLPLLRFSAPIDIKRRSIVFMLSATAAFFWLVFALISIRATLPLWSNNVNLWRWALAMYPDSTEAKGNLLSAYIDSEDYANANKLVDKLSAEHVQCINCMLNAALLAVNENDPVRAAIALEEVRNSSELATNKNTYRLYLLATGDMLILQGHLDDAEQVLRAAMEMEPLDPQPQLALAVALALQDKQEEAHEIGKSGMTLLTPDKRDSAQQMLNRAFATGAKPTSQKNQGPTAQ
jgi:tetratricopeptide (TPR) repeat protein